MSIKAEGFDKARVILAGLYKFGEEEPFNQAVLALNDEMMFLYNDHAPDVVSGDEWIYNIKERFLLNDVETVIDETLLKRPELSGLNRLAILIAGEEDPHYFYYYTENVKEVKNFLAALKHFGVETTSRKVKVEM